MEKVLCSRNFNIKKENYFIDDDVKIIGECKGFGETPSVCMFYPVCMHKRKVFLMCDHSSNLSCVLIPMFICVSF